MTRGCGCDPIWDRSIEAAPWPEVVELSEFAWRAQVGGLAERSPFHLRRHGQIAPTLAGLAGSPFTTKEDLRRAQQEHPPYGDHLGVDRSAVKLIYQTSGTSGVPSLIALTAADREVWREIGARSYWATGIHRHSSVLTTVAAGPFTVGNAHTVIERIGAGRVPVPATDTAKVVNAIELGLVDTLLATTSYALYLAGRITGRTKAQLAHLVVGGEPGGGHPMTRKRIETALGGYLTDVAGIGDVAPSLFGECPGRRGMHFCGQGLVWPELVDPATGAARTIEPGATGEMVYTSLRREAMPVVRFRSGDLVDVQEGDCGCERTSFRIEISGRVDDLVIVRGVNVYPAAVVAVVAEFQPAVTGRARLVLPVGAGVAVEPPVEIEVEAATNAAEVADRIETAIRSRLGFRAKVTMVQPEIFGEPGHKTTPIIRR